MYVLFALILFACNPASLVPGSQDGASLKRGRFFYRSELSSNTYTIDRPDALQIETNNLTKELSRWEITWTGPVNMKRRVWIHCNMRIQLYFGLLKTLQLTTFSKPQKPAMTKYYQIPCLKLNLIDEVNNMRFLQAVTYINGPRRVSRRGLVGSLEAITVFAFIACGDV